MSNKLKLPVFNLEDEIIPLIRIRMADIDCGNFEEYLKCLILADLVRGGILKASIFDLYYE